MIPLCREDHRLFDTGQIDLLPFEHRFNAEMGFAVERFGLLSTLRQVSKERWVPERSAA